MTPIIYVSFLCTILDMGQDLSPDGPYIYMQHHMYHYAWLCTLIIVGSYSCT